MNILAILGAAVMFCVLLVIVMVWLEDLAFAWLAEGMKVQARYRRGDYNGGQKLLAAIFVAGFLIYDFFLRNTLIVVALRVRPAFELVTTLLQDITNIPRVYTPEQVFIANEYRIKIEKIDDAHFHGRNRACMHLLDRLRRQPESAES